MKTVFKKGMKVYDQIVFPNEEGEVIEIRDYKDYPILVETESGNTYSYTLDGRVFLKQTPTLSISPYKLEGFRQAPTFGEALKWLRDEYLDESVTYKIDGEKYFADYYYSKNAPYKSFEALRKLIIFRDYYNNGWQPNWQDDEWKYFIEYYRGKLDVERTCCNGRVLAFKSKEIRDKFLEEQKELLEIAKPLL